MADPLVVAYTVAYDDVEDGWVMAQIVEKPGAISQGRVLLQLSKAEGDRQW